MWVSATLASDRASGLDYCCCLLLCALPWLGWLARCALPCQPLFRNNNSTAAFGGRRRLRRRCCCCCGTEAGKARHSEQASQAKAKHIATNNNNERGLAFRVWAGGGRAAVSLPYFGVGGVTATALICGGDGGGSALVSVILVDALGFSGPSRVPGSS